MLRQTGIFLNALYPINNSESKRIRIGDVVIVHPTKNSISKEPFEATIVSRFINWTNGACHELCTNVKNGYSAVINEYLFKRLEFKSRP